jgi:FMN phosphatase YigB (HAD superfamily)
MWKLLIFDLGETLIDFNLAGKWHNLLKNQTLTYIYQDIKHIFRDSSNNLRKAPTEDEFKAVAYPIMGKPHDVQKMPDRIKEYLDQFEVPHDKELIDKHLQFWFDTIHPYPYIYPEVFQALLTITETKKFQISLWSDTPFQTPGKYIEAFMEKFHIRQFFNSVFFSGDYDFRKPDPRTMQAIQELHGVKKEEMVYIGNTPRDVQTGINFGIDSIWVNRTKEEFPQNHQKPTLTIQSIAEILPIISIN